MTRSGRKHRIGKERVLAALRNAGDPIIEGDAALYVGEDDEGVELEIVLVPDDKRPGDYAIIHAMRTDWRSR